LPRLGSKNPVAPLRAAGIYAIESHLNTGDKVCLTLESVPIVPFVHSESQAVGDLA